MGVSFTNPPLMPPCPPSHIHSASDREQWNDGVLPFSMEGNRCQSVLGIGSGASSRCYHLVPVLSDLAHLPCPCPSQFRQSRRRPGQSQTPQTVQILLPGARRAHE